MRMMTRAERRKKMMIKEKAVVLEYEVEIGASLCMISLTIMTSHYAFGLSC